jgi:hypothetical protein
VQVEHRGAGRAEHGPCGKPLHGARREQPDHRLGDHVQARGEQQRDERADQDGSATDLVREPADQQQRGEHADRVDRVDRGQHGRREVPGGRVVGVQRRRRGRGEQRQRDDPGDQDEVERRGESALGSKNGDGHG